MINIEDLISVELQQEARVFEIFDQGAYQPTDCKCWVLPPPTDADKSLVEVDGELRARLYELRECDPTSPKIAEINESRERVLEGVKMTKMHGMLVYTPHDLLIKDERKGIRKEWWKYKQLAVDNASRLFLACELSDSPEREADTLVLMPGSDPYRYLHLHGTRGNNFPVETDEITRRLKIIEEDIGLDIVSASFDSVEILLHKPVTGANSRKIRYHLTGICPYIEELTSALRLGRVQLWWD